MGIEHTLTPRKGGRDTWQIEPVRIDLDLLVPRKERCFFRKRRARMRLREPWMPVAFMCLPMRSFKHPYRHHSQGGCFFQATLEPCSFMFSKELWQGCSCVTSRLRTLMLSYLFSPKAKGRCRGDSFDGFSLFSSGCHPRGVQDHSGLELSSCSSSF